ncbi:unnamed protein product [Gordionus sp. m RMFG-2023]
MDLQKAKLKKEIYKEKKEDLKNIYGEKFIFRGLPDDVDQIDITNLNPFIPSNPPALKDYKAIKRNEHYYGSNSAVKSLLTRQRLSRIKKRVI